MFSLFTAGLAALAPLASAYTTPTGDGPKGNPIAQPGLNTIVPVGESFSITWDPTTEGTVSLVLLKGPAENLIPVYAIAEKIQNSGSYSWDPKSTLEPSEGAQGYGIQLIDDKTGQYQYTTQFGISNKAYNEAAESSPAGYASVSSSAVAAPSSYAAAPSSYAEHVSSAASSVAEPATTAVEEATTPAVVAPVVTAPTAPYEIPNNSTGVQPTGGFSTRTPSPSGTGNNGTSVVPSTGGASNMAASFGGLVIAAGVAVFAL